MSHHPATAGKPTEMIHGELHLTIEKQINLNR